MNPDQTVRFGSVRYSTPPGLVGREVWVRADGDELVITANLARGLTEVARHRLSTPGNPRIDLGHYPDHPQQTDGSPSPRQAKARSRRTHSCSLGQGRTPGSSRQPRSARNVRSKMTAALELAVLVGTGPVGAALGLAAAAGQFAEGDLVAIVQHRANGASTSALVVADDAHSVQPGTSAWDTFGARPEVTP